jgi:hypothetical protein
MDEKQPTIVENTAEKRNERRAAGTEDRTKHVYNGSVRTMAEACCISTKSIELSHQVAARNGKNNGIEKFKARAVL